MATYGLVCVNGHAMDEGLFECPCCGAYRPARCLTEGMTSAQQMAAIRRATADLYWLEPLQEENR